MVVCIAEIDRIVDHCLKYLFIKTSSYNCHHVSCSQRAGANRNRHRMVVGFTTTYVISSYHD